VADRSHRQVATESLDYCCLQRAVLQVWPHATGAMSTGQEQAVEIGEPDVFPAQRSPVFRGLHHLSIRSAAIVIGAQEPGYSDKISQTGSQTPRIQPAPGEHDFVRLSGQPGRRGEAHGVTQALENPPAHGNLSGVKVELGSRYQYRRHSHLATAQGAPHC
jgi:hypothetical protein